LNNGKLYVVSTPIGNLGDMTFRAVEILKSVELIASEDTRHTGVLLQHYGISTRQTPYHDHNKERVTPGLVETLEGGGNIAVVSDAGTPGISDPGFYLVRACLKAGIEVIPIPGASSMLAALVVSGLPTDRFSFEGFLPKTSGRARNRLAELKGDSRTLIFFESPHRVIKTLNLIKDEMGDRQVFVGRELTKKFEQHYHGSISEVVNSLTGGSVKGEIVIAVSGMKENFD
jgi:16S rRNA (cytidine1402-2'-O)-methyltransferase